jgi:hypothetical protein
MAKAKKSESSSSKKSAPKPAAKSAPSGFPSIDTNLAAQSAAKMLLRKPTVDSTGSKKESGAFKNLKDSLNKPSMGSLDQFMGSTGPQRSNTSHHRDQQKGHNQTFGADVNRTGVPRRTTGG